MDVKRHTEGPWLLDIDTSVSPNEDRNWDVYANVPDGPDHEIQVRVCDMADCRDMEWNASLICAAPDLLAACEAAETCLVSLVDMCADADDAEVLEQVREAIAKARRGAR